MIQIVQYETKYAEVFKNLNYAWINKYFQVEEMDIQMLGNPESYILKKGGAIFIALLDKKPVGTCALISKGNQVYELAKMAVAEEAQRKMVGWKLGREVIEKAKKLKAKKLFLETNSRLIPAINLYKKLGFEQVISCETPYSRCDLQMELLF